MIGVAPPHGLFVSRWSERVTVTLRDGDEASISLSVPNAERLLLTFWEWLATPPEARRSWMTHPRPLFGWDEHSVLILSGHERPGLPAGLRAELRTRGRHVSVAIKDDRNVESYLQQLQALLPECAGAASHPVLTLSADLAERLAPPTAADLAQLRDWRSAGEAVSTLTSLSDPTPLAAVWGVEPPAVPGRGVLDVTIRERPAGPLLGGVRLTGGTTGAWCDVGLWGHAASPADDSPGASALAPVIRQLFTAGLPHPQVLTACWPWSVKERMARWVGLWVSHQNLVTPRTLRPVIELYGRGYRSQYISSD